MEFTDKTILITGGTGSLGHKIVKRLMTGEMGSFKKIIIFSRDEDKHHHMALEWNSFKFSKNNIFYNRKVSDLLEFKIGDVRDYSSVISVMRVADVVIHAAAMKQILICEYFPFESVKTNILGIEHIVRSIKEGYSPAKIVLIISTDKACQPINTYGMSKGIQERIAIESNISIGRKDIKVICVRYGNVMGSRGSVIPLFESQIQNKQVLTITSEKMTRFMMSLDNSVDIIFAAIKKAYPGEIYVPNIPSAKIIDIAKIMVGDKNVKIKNIGIRPGEKIHEILVSQEEAARTIREHNYMVICPSFTEIRYRHYDKTINEEISSENFILSNCDLKELLEKIII